MKLGKIAKLLDAFLLLDPTHLPVALLFNPPLRLVVTGVEPFSLIRVMKAPDLFLPTHKPHRTCRLIQF